MRPKVSQSAAGISRIASSSRKFDERRRVLEGMGGVRVEEPPAVGAELLDRDLGGGGSELQ